MFLMHVSPISEVNETLEQEVSHLVSLVDDFPLRYNGVLVRD